MSDRPASLLTKTQRQRLDNEFEDVEGAKRRRDRQRIRERVAAGLGDVEYLVEYPDDQLELAVEDVDDEQLVRRLADLHLLGERLRVLRDVDGDAVVETARERAETAEADVPSLDRAELQRRDAAAATAGGQQQSPWRRRGELLLTGGLLLLLPALALGVVAPDLASGPVGGIPALFGATGLLFGAVLVAIYRTKHDVLPALGAFLADPAGSVRRLWARI